MLVIWSGPFVLPGRGCFPIYYLWRNSNAVRSVRTPGFCGAVFFLLKAWTSTLRPLLAALDGRPAKTKPKTLLFLRIIADILTDIVMAMQGGCFVPATPPGAGRKVRAVNRTTKSCGYDPCGKSCADPSSFHGHKVQNIFRLIWFQ